MCRRFTLLKSIQRLVNPRRVTGSFRRKITGFQLAPPLLIPGAMRTPILVALIAASTATAARAAEPAPAPSLTAPAPETTRVNFGGQIVLADVSTLVLATVVAQKTGDGHLFLAYPLAAPLVHVAHGDGRGAMGSLALHAGLPVAGAFLGFAVNRAGCGSGEFMCGLGGFGIGGLVGLVSATLIDATYLAHVERPVARPARSIPTPTVAVAPGGGLMLGMAGRL